MPYRFTLTPTQRKKLINQGFDLRCYVLRSALQMESITSNMLRIILRINSEGSLAFGHSSRALSFDQRIQLLIEVGALDEKHRVKFQWFLQIRNQLMHNDEAISMTSLLKFTTVKDKELLKAFPQNKRVSHEEQLGRALKHLCKYVESTSSEIFTAAIYTLGKERWIDVKARRKFLEEQKAKSISSEPSGSPQSPAR